MKTDPAPIRRFLPIAQQTAMITNSVAESIIYLETLAIIVQVSEVELHYS